MKTLRPIIFVLVFVLTLALATTAALAWDGHTWDHHLDHVEHAGHHMDHPVGKGITSGGPISKSDVGPPAGSE